MGLCNPKQLSDVIYERPLVRPTDCPSSETSLAAIMPPNRARGLCLSVREASKSLRYLPSLPLIITSLVAFRETDYLWKSFDVSGTSKGVEKTIWGGKTQHRRWGDARTQEERGNAMVEWKWREEGNNCRIKATEL